MEVCKTHPMAQIKGPFGISEKLRELICLLGQSQVFGDGQQLFSQMMGISMGEKQIQRVSEYYGEQIEEKQDKEIQVQAPVPYKAQANEKTYVMVDGSMLFTREEGWKEIKVGRIFSENNRIAIQENKNIITDSQYVCHLGEHTEFLRKMEWHIDNHSELKICIADGAPWIWKWVEQMYPQMVQILDFYHAVEKLSQYALYQIEDKKRRGDWMHKQKERLLNNDAGKIILLLQNTVGRNNEAEKARNDVLRYYQTNLKRMQYKTYQDAGYLIGSGAIESAHRNVVQQRLKLSGQRWSKKGAQQIVNLRAINKSNQWEQVIELIKNAA